MATYTTEEVEKIKDRILSALEGVNAIEFEDSGRTEIQMTLTTMGCPLADLLTEQIHDALKEVPEVSEVDVKLVWYPAWSVDKMSRYARIALGIR